MLMGMRAAQKGEMYGFQGICFYVFNCSQSSGNIWFSILSLILPSSHFCNFSLLTHSSHGLTPSSPQLQPTHQQERDEAPPRTPTPIRGPPHTPKSNTIVFPSAPRL
ncbi:hypothetical protein ACB098_02G036900 [Castanea mollissima]